MSRWKCLAILYLPMPRPTRSAMRFSRSVAATMGSSAESNNDPLIPPANGR